MDLHTITIELIVKARRYQGSAGILIVPIRGENALPRIEKGYLRGEGIEREIDDGEGRGPRAVFGDPCLRAETRAFTIRIAPATLRAQENKGKTDRQLCPPLGPFHAKSLDFSEGEGQGSGTFVLGTILVLVERNDEDEAILAGTGKDSLDDGGI
jgi:hypothetical protein